MGLFSVPLTVIGTDGARSARLVALVDTGVIHTMLPSDMLAGLGITPVRQIRIRTADNRISVIAIGDAVLEVEGVRDEVEVMFGTPGGMALLGASTLERLEFGVDPVRERLIPSPLLRTLWQPPAT